MAKYLAHSKSLQGKTIAETKAMLSRRGWNWDQQDFKSGKSVALVLLPNYDYRVLTIYYQHGKVVDATVSGDGRSW
ncbi:MAG: hypothetical protein IPK73_04520 [Candidatus Obscuribacter sp.]|nr:hypothetical protein [Candidatus Obscuribacter sp.]MBK9280940.1 hypothetical protein [Candidatus Obscuribacter sp.]